MRPQANNGSIDAVVGGYPAYPSSADARCINFARGSTNDISGAIYSETGIGNSSFDGVTLSYKALL
jgi:hypothetical protein